MSILIKGINKPTDARNCKFYDTDPLGIRKPYCAIQSVCNGLDSCPLIELPPHGDLIDRSKLAWTPIDITDLPYRECLPVYLKEDVDDAPIVVESDDGE